MSLGENIYKLRTEKHLSQGDLAEQLQVSRQSISKWENNSAVPDLDKLIRLSDIFGISLDELVKGEEANEELVHEVKTEVVYEKHSGFPPRKIAGTILLCMAFFVSFFFLFMGGGLAGLIFALPFLLCGIICFVFQKNVGLWCAWTVYFLFDIYMSYATGISRSSVLHSFQWTYEMNYMRLAFAWILFLSLVGMIVITILRFRKKPVSRDKTSQRKIVSSWCVFLLIQLVAMIWPHTGFYSYILANIFSMEVVYRLILLVLDWCKIISFTVSMCYTVRYIKSR